MSNFNLILDPFGELFMEDGGANVSEPLFRGLWELKRGFRQVSVHLRIVFVEIAPDLLYAEAFVPV